MAIDSSSASKDCPSHSTFVRTSRVFEISPLKSVFQASAFTKTDGSQNSLQRRKKTSSFKSADKDDCSTHQLAEVVSVATTCATTVASKSSDVEIQDVVSASSSLSTTPSSKTARCQSISFEANAIVSVHHNVDKDQQISKMFETKSSRLLASETDAADTIPSQESSLTFGSGSTFSSVFESEMRQLDEITSSGVPLVINSHSINNDVWLSPKISTPSQNTLVTTPTATTSLSSSLSSAALFDRECERTHCTNGRVITNHRGVHHQQQFRVRNEWFPFHFDSVLDHPFPLWSELGRILSAVPHRQELNRFQTGKLIHHLIRFLELKLFVSSINVKNSEDYLLIPSPLVETAWHVVALETQVYKRVFRCISEFHYRHDHPQQDQFNRHFIPCDFYPWIAAMATCDKPDRDYLIDQTQYLYGRLFRDSMPITCEHLSDKLSVRRLPLVRDRNVIAHEAKSQWQPFCCLEMSGDMASTISCDSDDSSTVSDDLFGLSLL